MYDGGGALAALLISLVARWIYGALLPRGFAVAGANSRNAIYLAVKAEGQVSVNGKSDVPGQADTKHLERFKKYYSRSVGWK